ncbi:MAG: TolC family protein [Prevotellaceae bacterium]|nr:TolC family protein [Prevotellaceae bacterium]
MKKLLFTFSLLLTMSSASAQKVMSLKECLTVGIENNLSLKSSRNQVTKGKHNISENRARLLPQINFAAGFNDNFTPPVSVTDGTAYGKQYNVTKTLQYNSSASLQLQMPLYSQTALTAVEISKTLDNINQLSYEKAREDIIMQIAKLYYLIQNTTEQITIISDNLKRFEELRNFAQAFYDNQMALAVDLKRINVRIESTDVSLANAKAMLREQYNMLKYALDYPADEDIQVEVKRVDDIEMASQTGLNTNLYELQLMRTQEKLSQQQVKLAKDAYLPTLALTGNFTFTAYTDKFKNWFHSGESNHWYDSNGLGISLRVPVFDGFEKRSKIRKAKIDADNARIAYENTLKNLQTQYSNAINDQLNNERNYRKQRDNYRLAEDIYKVTMDRYREGVTSMVEVLQDEMSMSEAQNNYLTAHYNYEVSNLSVLKLTGNLNSLLGK